MRRTDGIFEHVHVLRVGGVALAGHVPLGLRGKLLIVVGRTISKTYVVATSVSIPRRNDQLSSTRIADASDGSLIVLDDERSGHVVGL